MKVALLHGVRKAPPTMSPHDSMIGQTTLRKVVGPNSLDRTLPETP